MTAKLRTPSQPLDALIEARNKAMRDLDLDACRNFCGRPMSDEVALLTLHKARYECTAIEPTLRHQSRAWLAERGYKRMTGDELLPEGALPE